MKVFGIVGWKNSGKTGLVERLVDDITNRGVTVSTMKHAHHNFDVDQKGKDSFRHRKAGAHQVLLSSDARWVLMTELRESLKPTIEEQLRKMDPVDLVLIEGFKTNDHLKIETYRSVTGQKLIAPSDKNIIAVATNDKVDTVVPTLNLDDTKTIADFVLKTVGLL
ncbi:MAG: molybdopterin-guanine dinucleotide biosynthesis protein B [Paracoccaceae bacterium]|nr:molybdopterin-guanine dinucleotide biosynthesis protein B [Paracoccaceae bacterium]